MSSLILFAKAGCLCSAVFLALVIVAMMGAWKAFAKAGQPGWGAFVPILNIYIACKIAGRPDWWFLLLLIPVVQIVFAIFVCIDIAENFGKGPLYGIGLVLLPCIFWPVLGLSEAQYRLVQH